MSKRTVVGVAALLGAVGCGGGGVSSTAHVTWKADGAALAASVQRVEWDSDGVVDTFAFFASTATRSLQVELSGPAPLSPATFMCGRTPPEALIGYQSGAQAAALTAETCTIVLTQVGKTPDHPVTGTFEATFANPDGGTIVFSDGTFRLPLRF